MTLGPGQVLNQRYRIVKLLGQGGFGAVYKAWDLNMERPRALKENLETSEESQRQFKREAQILGDLTHPNMPKVIDHFVIPGQGQYLVMEFVEGQDLEEILLQRGAIPENQALTWIRQVCDALSYLHSQIPPVIHRDIKPANIKIHPNGKAMLVDFGIAKTYDPNSKTSVGARAITPGYSPQEQYGLGNTDARTDIYALGATLYHLLTGIEPPESIQRAIDTNLVPPRQINPGITASTEAAILKAMEMHPSQRYQNAAEFQAGLAGQKQEPVSPPIVTVSPSLNIHAAETKAALSMNETIAAAPHAHTNRAIAADTPQAPAPEFPIDTSQPDKEFNPIKTAAPFPFLLNWIGSLTLLISAASGVVCSQLMIYTDGWEAASWLMLVWVLLILYALQLSGKEFNRRKAIILLAAAAILLFTVLTFNSETKPALLFSPIALGAILISLGIIDRIPSILILGLGCLVVIIAWIVFNQEGWVDPAKLGLFDAINVVLGMAASIMAFMSRSKIPNP